MSIPKFSVKNHVLVNLLMVGLFIFGGIALLQMPRELDPDIDFNWIFITVLYPGAAPQETESLIVDPIEDEIQDVDNIDEIQSTAGEELGFVLVKFEDISEADFNQRYNDLQSEVDQIDFPEEAEDPIIEKFSSGDIMPVITINMSFAIPEDNAQKIAEDLEEDIDDIPGVAKIQVSGLAEREIWVEVDPEKINSYKVMLEEIIFALKARNLNMPGGNISFGKSEYIIRSLGEYQSVKEIGETVIRATPSGEFIKIKDVAKVNDTREDLDILSRINGENAITFSVSKKSYANSIDVINEIKAVVRAYEDRVPDGISFTFTNDNSIYIKRIIKVLRNNAWLGIFLIVFVLFLFLGGWNALLAALGIPISFFITFIFMMVFGYSLNGPSLFALIIVLGIIVDDAIIVIENCHRYRLLGFNSRESAIRGTEEVVTPIFTSILTNIAAFLPLILLPGITGKFMRIIPTVFSMALVASLFEAFILLPSHYADWTKKSKIHEYGEKQFFKKIKKRYSRLLIKMLRMRYVFLGIMVVLLGISIGITFKLEKDMFGKDDLDQFKVLIRFPQGISLEENNRIMKQFETEAMNLDDKDIDAVIVNIGLLQAASDWIVSKSVSQILVQLTPQETRDIHTDEYMEILRKRIQHIEGPLSVEFEQVSGGPPVGKPVSIRVSGKYIQDVKKASLALQVFLKKIDGVHAVTDDFPLGKNEIKIVADEEKAALYGFTTQNISTGVRCAFDGIEATEYRDGDDEFDIVVKYNEASRSSVDDVLNLKLTNPAGKTVALRDMVKFEITPGPTEIKRFNRKRTIIITADINKAIVSMDVVNLKAKKIFPDLEKKIPGVSFEFGGQFDEFVNVFEDVLFLFVVSMIIVFLILGTQFNSYTQPLIILISVPFALIGALLGLIISQNPFSIVALFGVVALAGIVVNDAIVMIDFINRRRKGKQTTVFQYWRSIVNSGRLRLRPIILTTLTTVSGLIPMAFGIGGISEMWSPLANVILFGLLVDTIVTLFFIPCMVAVLDDILMSRKKAPIPV